MYMYVLYNVFIKQGTELFTSVRVYRHAINETETGSSKGINEKQFLSTKETSENGDVRSVYFQFWIQAIPIYRHIKDGPVIEEVVKANTANLRGTATTANRDQ